jgi:hypothetical protein
MSAYPPPLYSFTGLDFNPAIFEVTDTFTQGEANNLYLQKTVADTATVLETFQQNIIITTRTSGDNSTYAASTAFVTAAISALSSVYQTAAQVTTSINSALATFLTVSNTFTASQQFNGLANTINGAGIMSVNGLTKNVIVRMGSSNASTSPGTAVSYGFTYGSNPRVFITNNTSTQQIGAHAIGLTAFRLISNAGTPTCNWIVIGVEP